MYVKLLGTLGLMALGAVNAAPAAQSKPVTKVEQKKAIVVAKADDKKAESPKAGATDGGTATPTPVKKGSKGK